MRSSGSASVRACTSSPHFSFLFLRAAAEGVRVFAVSIVIGIAIGTNDVFSIAIICALTLIYTLEGGMAAVIWTDVVQMGL